MTTQHVFFCLQIPNIGTTEFSQGRTMRWGIAWSFDMSIKFPVSEHFLQEFRFGAAMAAYLGRCKMKWGLWPNVPLFHYAPPPPTHKRNDIQDRRLGVFPILFYMPGCHCFMCLDAILFYVPGCHSVTPALMWGSSELHGDSGKIRCSIPSPLNGMAHRT